jgi:hypothetical protein
MYPAIPTYQIVTPRDPMNYKLRPKEEVAEEFRLFEPDFTFSTSYKRYTAGDVRQTPDNRDNRDRVAKIRVDIRHLRLAPL